jgi:serine/threonine-protein kinase
VTPSAAATTTAGALEALSKMRHSIDEGAAAGQVRPDVAVDFNNLISQLQARLSAGEPVPDLNDRVGQLRVKIDQRLREGGLTAARAQDLRAALSGAA